MDHSADCTHDYSGYPKSVPSPVLSVREPQPLNSVVAEHTSVNPKKSDSSLVTLLDLFSLFVLVTRSFPNLFIFAFPGHFTFLG